jgi:hypothetical protein
MMWHLFQKIISFPESSFLLCGSSINGSRTGASDVDFICHSKYVTYVYSERFFYKGQQLHLIYFPRFKVIDYLICDAYSRETIYINMWRNSHDLLRDSNPLLLSIQDYLSALQKTIVIPPDDFVYYQIQKIASLSEVLNSKENSPLLIASELLLSVATLIVGKRCDTKHLAREITDNGFFLSFMSTYENAVSTHEFGPLCSEAQRIIQHFSVKKNASTTGLSFNTLPNDYLIVYIPGMAKQVSTIRFLHEIELLFSRIANITYYSFNIEPNQALDAGLYLCVYGNKEDLNSVYKELLVFHKHKLEYCRGMGIKMLYPYRTAFSSGYFFGGINVQRELTHFFCDIYKYLYRTGGTPNKERLYSIAMCIYQVFASRLQNGTVFLESVRDSILVDAVDPLGIYNIEQLRMISSSLENKKEQYNAGNDSEYPGKALIRTAIEHSLTYVSTLREAEIFFPSLSPAGNKRETLLRYILLHVHDIMMLSYPQRYETLCMFLQS